MQTMFRPSWAYKSSTPVTGTAAGVGVGGTGRGVGVGGSGVAVGVWSGVAVGAGVAVGGGAVILWLPSRAPTMSTAIPTEMSRIMAPRATSSCRLCRQFIQTSALDPDPRSHTHRAHSGSHARSRHSGRDTTKPSRIGGLTQVRATIGISQPSAPILTGAGPVDTIPATSIRKFAGRAAAIATIQGIGSGVQLRPRGLATQDPWLCDASGNDSDPLKEETTMRRRLVTSFVILVVIATMFPLSMTSLAQTPVAAPNTDISGTIDVGMVANPQMVALQEIVESGAFNELYPNIVVNLTVLPENEIRQTITQDVTTQSGQFDVFTIGPFEGPAVG